MGRVIDEKVAEDKSIPCHGYRYIDPKTKEVRYLLWKPSILGTLTDKQEEQFCDKDISDIKEGLPRRLEERFKILRGLKRLEEECPCLTKAEREEFYKIIDAAVLSSARKESLKKSIEDIMTC